MDLYREEILEHWQNPQNFGKVIDADLVIDQVNPLCGDQVTFYFKFARGRISDVSFTGSGCAISVAASSMLSEFIKGKSIKDLEKLTGEKVLDLIGGLVAPARLKCVFLPLEVIRRLRLYNGKTEK